MGSLAETIGPSVVRARAWLANVEKNPLDSWHYASTQSFLATQLLSHVDEVYARAGNVGGKTEWVMATALAICQKRRELDGVPLPQWRGKVDAVCLVLDHKQQKLSVQQTLLRLLGSWPHHPRYGANGVLASVMVQPLEGNDDRSRWSTLEFMSQENRRSGVGIRADLIIGDEPPREEIWREIRKAGHAGRRSKRIIDCTPTIRPQWQWLADEYGMHDCPRGGYLVRGNRAEVRWSVHDNTALSEAEIAALIAEYETDPLSDARIFGEYVDTSGLCPFHIPTLQAMLASCVDADLIEWEVQREVASETGLVKAWCTETVEVLDRPRPGVRYTARIDPSKGINDKNHDPGGILISRDDTGEDVALYEGYIGAYGLGTLAAALCRQYNEATANPENNGGWGEGVFRGLADSGYRNIAHTHKPLQPGKFETVLGFQTTATTRPAQIEAVQEWVEAHRIGAPYAPCSFRRVIESLLQTVLDTRGRVVAAPGYHDEFLILKGQALRTRPRRHDPNMLRHRPKPVRPMMSPDEITERWVRGEDVETPARIGAGRMQRRLARPPIGR